MGRTEKIEYHSVCPSCGAAGHGAFCEYCGSSLIKSKSIIEVPDVSLEEQFLAEDAGVPMINGKSCGKSGAMTVFSALFGGVFLAVPTIICISFLSFGFFGWWILLFLSIFWAIGLGAILTPIIKSINRKKCQNGRFIRATVRGYEDGSVMINDRPVQNMRLRLDDPDVILLLATGETNRHYAVGSVIGLRNYKNYYMIDNEEYR